MQEELMPGACSPPGAAPYLLTSDSVIMPKTPASSEEDLKRAQSEAGDEMDLRKGRGGKEADRGSGGGDGEEDFLDLRVLTLNCWGLKFVSEKRRERMAAIGAYLARAEYDIVLLQEVWMGEDYETIRTLAAEAFPHTHFFDNGIIGSGTCILTKTRISDATFHEFSMNGYPHKIWHGDWFGGKGLGVCQIMYRGFDIHIYTSHYHAEYNRQHDVYLGHRVIHALESAQWVRLASSSADLTIYGGDFNTEPTDVPYKLVRMIVPLQDSWQELHGEGPGGETCDIPGNSFAHPRSLTEYPNGKRIDYIMYCPGPNIQAQALSCSLPLPARVPGKSFSYSDHEAVTATIRLSRKRPGGAGALRLLSGPEYKREVSLRCRAACVGAVGEALEILRRSEDHVEKDELRYSLLASMLLILLLVSFIPIALLDSPYHAVIEMGLFLPRLVATVGMIFFALMASVFNKKERNALRSARTSLQLIHDQDVVESAAGGHHSHHRHVGADDPLS